MRTSRGIAALSALAMAITGMVALATPARAAVFSLPVVSETQVIGDRTLTLAKDDYAVVDVQVRMQCPPPSVCPSFDNPDTYFNPFLKVATLAPGSGGPRGRWTGYQGPNASAPRFVRISGDAVDGVYRASVAFTPLDSAWTSQQRGSYVMKQIGFPNPQAYGITELGSVDLGLTQSERTVSVSGADPIILRASIAPGAVRPGTRGSSELRYLVASRDSGRVREGRSVYLCLPEGCPEPTDDYQFAAKKVTDASGFTAPIRWGYPPLGGTAYYVRALKVHGADELFTIDWAGVDPSVQSKPSATWANIKSSVSSIAAGGTMTLSGSVGGNGSPTRPNTVLVQRWVGGKWTTLGRALLLVNGRWSYVTVPRSLGVNQYRVVKPSNACSAGVCYSPNASSGTVRVTVR
jgi:hypothetical protein